MDYLTTALSTALEQFGLADVILEASLKTHLRTSQALNPGDTIDCM